MDPTSAPKLPEERWAEVLQFYRRLNEDHDGYEPMIRFVEWFGSTKCSEVLYPVTSMTTLVISMVATFPDRLMRPQVFVTYHRERQGFLLSWYTPPGMRKVDEWVGSPSDPEVLRRILSWLEVPLSYGSESRRS